VVTFRPDGTFVLNTGNVSTTERGLMPTPTTSRRIYEFSPAQVGSHLQHPHLHWSAFMVPRSPMHALLHDTPRAYFSLAWPDVKHLVVDEDGEPVLSELFAQIFPWRWEKLNRVQNWRPPVNGEWVLMTDNISPHKVLAVRRTWGKHTVVGTVGRLGNGEVVWQVRDAHKERVATGTASSVEEAMQLVDRRLQRRGLSLEQPRLGHLLASKDRYTGRGHYTASGLKLWPELYASPFDWQTALHPIRHARVRRMHVARPWTTRLAHEDKSQRGWLPDSAPWPLEEKDVRVWFELENGEGVALARRGDNLEVVRAMIPTTPTVWMR
jgi:hypothetical protein